MVTGTAGRIEVSEMSDPGESLADVIRKYGKRYDSFKVTEFSIKDSGEESRTIFNKGMRTCTQ